MKSRDNLLQEADSKFQMLKEGEDRSYLIKVLRVVASKKSKRVGGDRGVKVKVRSK